jgi:hypothetical protein
MIRALKTYCTLTKEQASLYAAVLEDIEEVMEEAEEGAEKKTCLKCWRKSTKKRHPQE